MESGQSFVDVFSGVIDAMIVVPQRTEGFVDVSIGGKIKTKSGLLHRVVIIEVLTPEKPTAGAAIALWTRVEIVQVSRCLGNSKTTCGCAGGQLIKTTHQHGGLIAGDNRGSRKDRRISGGVRSSLVESPYRLGRDPRVRSYTKIRVLPHSFDEKFLRWKLVEKLETVRSRSEHAVELASAFEGEPVCRVDGAVGTDSRRHGEPRIAELSLGQHRRNGEGVNKRRGRRAAAQLTGAGIAAAIGPSTQPALRYEIAAAGEQPEFDRFSSVKPSSDELAAVLLSIEHLLPLGPRNFFSKNIEIHVSSVLVSTGARCERPPLRGSGCELDPV